jgi:hypothetical protein
MSSALSLTCSTVRVVKDLALASLSSDPTLPVARALSRDLEHNSPQARAVLLVNAKWENAATLGVRFLSGSSALHTKVETHARTWEQFANIKLNFGGDGDAIVRIAFAQDGHWSQVGKFIQNVSAGQPTMNLQLTDGSPDDDIQRVVLHEFGHTLGLMHEHQSPAGGGIQWDRNKALEFYRQQGWSPDMIEEQVFKKLNENQTNHTGIIDKASIMMYPIPEGLTLNGFNVGWNKDISNLDKAFIGGIYPLKKKEEMTLVIGGGPVTGFIHPGQVDQYHFDVKSAGPLIIETHGGSALGMKLFDKSDRSTVPIRENEGGGDELNAMIATTLKPGTYFLDVYHQRRETGEGPYTITID